MTLVPLPNNHAAITVPEGAHSFSLHTTERHNPQIRFYIPGDAIFHVRQLHPGNYTIVGPASEITEEQAGEIVESVAPTVCKDYMSSKYCDNYLESFRSLLTSLSLDKNVLIIKQNK